MPKIKVLDKHTAELIAAGEVVERPLSVIKELVENSVDSGAKNITVEIRGGGSTFMRVTDNGCGIEKNDVATAFLRHATSKVKDENDLNSISTLGFRGEALASISAVARVELLTKTADEEIGARYTVIGGESAVVEDAGCPCGTTIIVRDLFFNTPARMKFLKKDVTEGNAVAGIVDKIALSHPEISFSFIRDGKQTLHTPGDGELFSSIYAVFGKQFSDNLIPVDYELNHIKVSGYISKPTASRPNRSMQNFFINSRFIRSRTASAALDESYKGSVMVGKFAACILNLEMSFEAVDINVHPAKLEVRFVNERPIFDAVYHAVKSALNKDDSKKVMQFSKPMEFLDAAIEKAEQVKIVEPKIEPSESVKTNNFTELQEQQAKPKVSFPSFAPTMKDSEPSGLISKPEIPKIFEQVLQAESDKINDKIDNVKLNDITEKTTEIDNQIDFPIEKKSDVVVKYIGEAFDTYIVLQYGNSAIMLIDKHAAHERLLYEKLKKQGRESAAQMLLEPVTVTLDKDSYTQILQNADTLLKVGFEVEDFGPGMILVRSTPMFLDGSDAEFALEEIAGYLVSHKNDLTTEHLEWLYANISCRAAIKGGNKTTKEELIALVETLEANPEIKFCPHGRPISMLIKKGDIERQFGR